MAQLTFCVCMAEKIFPVIIFRFSCSLFEQSHAPLVSYVSVNFRIRIFLQFKKIIMILF